MATLDDLRAVRDKLLSGNLRVTIQSGGRSVTYAQPDLKDIERRIRELETEQGVRRTSIVAVRSSKNWS